MAAQRARMRPRRSAAQWPLSQVIYVHDTGGLGDGYVVNFNAGSEVEKMPRAQCFDAHAPEKRLWLARHRLCNRISQPPVDGVCLAGSR